MKILVISQHFYPEQFKVSDICFRLAKEGHDVTVLTGLPNYPSGVIDKKYKWFKNRNEKVKGVNILRSWLIGRGSGNLKLSVNYLSFALAATFKSLFIKKDFDLMLVYQTSPVTMALPGVLLKKLTKKPLIIYCHDLWPESIATVGITKDSVVYKVLFIISKWIYGNADKIFTSSKLFVEYFNNTLGIYKETVYLPVYAEDLFDNITANNMASDSINLVFAGNVGKMQSVDTIIYAANELKEMKNIKWHIVGDGSAKNTCEKLKNELDLENVIFHGQHPISEMPHFYRMADAFLITLKENKVISYTLPNKVQSYMAAGKPIIGAIDGETQEVIKTANCGLCCSSEDYKSLAKNVKDFVENKQMHRVYGENAKKYYEENFSKKIFFTRLNNLLKNSKKQEV
ncbi:glycosyltransferase family 4 protein [Fredinandcohnia salidurans]|uniref:Glycosyltransferase family 4 protein n=1 Tax=Fredinandcohnia salidurans TaxID=2595041 RepID=A0ABW4MRI3_9BACI